MVKQAPTLGRLLVMVGFALSCFGLLLFLWLAFGGPTPLSPKGYRFKTSFGEATQLAKEADVRISGVSVGKVKNIETQADGRSQALIQLKPRYAPLPKDSKAILRQKTLLGETYVELTPGNKSGGSIPEDGTLPASQVSPTVELDEIFRTFDQPTRTAFQQWMQSQSQSLAGRGIDINDALGNLAPFAEDANKLLEILNSQAGATRQLVRNSGVVFNALSERRGQLGSLITNSNRVFETTARRDTELSEIFHILPTFESESQLTVRRLAAYAKKTNPLITQLRPAARELSPTLVSLSALAPDAKALFRDLDKLTVASKKGLPATESFLDQLHPLLPEFDPVLRQLNPILIYIGNYRPELAAFFANTVAATQASNIPPYAKGTRVHYLRTLNPFNPENLSVYPNRLGSNRTNPYQFTHSSLSLNELLDGKPGNGPVSYETRHCANGVPTIISNGLPGVVSGATGAVSGVPGVGAGVAGVVNGVTGVVNGVAGSVPGAGVVSGISDQLLSRIKELAFTVFGSGEVAAPPCIQQKKFSPTTRPKSATTTQYPHVTEALTGFATRQKGK